MIRLIRRLFRRKTALERRIAELRIERAIAARKHKATRPIQSEVYRLKHDILRKGVK